MAAHPLAKEFFPAVPIFGHGRISIFFFEGGQFGDNLFVSCVDASRRGKEETLDRIFLSGEQEVCIDKYGEHASGFIMLDKAHAAHIGSEIKNITSATAG